MSERDDHRHPLPPEDDPDAPASAEEIAASARLRDALAAPGSPAVTRPGFAASAPTAPEDEVALALALKAAWAPGSLSREESEAVLDATPSADEQALAAALRDALEEPFGGRQGSPEVELARALRSAHAPAPLPDAAHRALVDAALARAPARSGGAVVSLQTRADRGVSARPLGRRVAFGALTAGLALAAAIFLVVTSAPMHGSEAPLARARTTQPLFTEPFKAGETSARIDRIAAARASDFRDNRFAKWGVR